MAPEERQVEARTSVSAGLEGASGNSVGGTPSAARAQGADCDHIANEADIAGRRREVRGRGEVAGRASDRLRLNSDKKH